MFEVQCRLVCLAMYTTRECHTLLCLTLSTLSQDPPALRFCCSKTTYVLQTLWRDLTSEYDIIGSYYTVPRQ